MKNNLAGMRGKQIVSALREHGPLSIKTLVSFLEPSTNRRRLSQAMSRLAEGGVVRRVHGSLPDNAGHFFALNRDERARVKIGKLLGVSANELKQAHIHGSELKHGEQCAKWAEFFRKSFPEAKVIRDWEWRSDRGLIANILKGGGDRDLMPDFIVTFPKDPGKESIQIGVEIERTRKWAARLVQKLKTIVYQTQFDGLIYVCEKFEVAEGVRRSFIKGEFTKSRRVGGYAENFLIFSRYEECVGSSHLIGVNLALKTRSIPVWIEALRSTPQHLRSDEMFE